MSKVQSCANQTSNPFITHFVGASSFLGVFSATTLGEQNCRFGKTPAFGSQCSRFGPLLCSCHSGGSYQSQLTYSLIKLFFFFSLLATEIPHHQSGGGSLNWILSILTRFLRRDTVNTVYTVSICMGVCPSLD